VPNPSQAIQYGLLEDERAIPVHDTASHLQEAAFINKAGDCLQE
jgi:hypothetical protein